jgi:hypothetical protein
MNIYISPDDEKQLRQWHSENDDRTMSGLIHILLNYYFQIYGVDQHNLNDSSELVLLLSDNRKSSIFIDHSYISEGKKMNDTKLELILIEYGNRVLDIRDGIENPTLGELFDNPKQQIANLIQTSIQEARIDELNKYKTTVINGHCYPFYSDELETYTEDRLNQLTEDKE